MKHIADYIHHDVLAQPVPMLQTPRTFVHAKND